MIENYENIRRIKTILREFLNLGNGDLNEKTDLQLDSLRTVELIVQLEEEFNFEFDIGNLEFENFRTINAIIATTLKNLESTNG
jgi:acyl carrier protein